jgi:hypothetical protein
MTDYLEFPAGLHLLTRWHAGDAEAKQALQGLIDDTIAGNYDPRFAEPATTSSVHCTASVHMLGLDILNKLYGITAAEYYKQDPKRYARVNLMCNRLLGVKKHYITWALYAFTSEATGQLMMYPDRFPPGSDPDSPLANKDNWRAVITTPDFTKGTPRIIDNILREYQNLTGMPPLIQLTAPYSLACDIYGQEPLLAEVVHNPDHVNELLDHIADQVLAPWIDHFTQEFPDGWVELSDASGSPFFIGPDNCKNMAIRSIQHMVKGKPWADRVFDCNYRGDYVTQAQKKARGSRRKSADKATSGGIDLLQLTDLKYDVCRPFMMRLDSDQVPVSFYADQSITRGIPLTTGIGSPRIDSNSIANLDIAKQEIRSMAHDFVAAIKTVCEHIGNPDHALIRLPLPSHVYFEDVNSLSQFELIEIIVQTVRDEGALNEVI